MAQPSMIRLLGNGSENNNVAYGTPNEQAWQDLHGETKVIPESPEFLEDQLHQMQEELTKLYSIKKGNRPLIIKTFLILNFLIVFMKAYARK